MTARPAHLVALAVAAAALFSCAPTAPDHPTYFDDVQPILQANCSRCHGIQPFEPQVGFFRLDRFVTADRATLDAWDMRAEIVSQAVHLAAPQMPPAFPLSGRQRETLRRWVEDGAPKGTRVNQPPQAELMAVLPATADQTLRVRYRAWDGDADGLWVRLFAGDIPLSFRLRQGAAATTLDTGRLPAGTYQIAAHLDDGAADDPLQNEAVVPLGEPVAVSHGVKGTAPTVRLLQPNGKAAVFGSAVIAWEATDPDPADSLTVDVALYRVDNGIPVLVGPVATGLANGPKSTVWTPAVPVVDALGIPLRYILRVTATDLAGNARSDDSDAPFILAPPSAPTALTWADVKPIFEGSCLGCHGEPAKYDTLDTSRFDKHSMEDPVAPLSGDDGVYERRGAIYQRALVDTSEPPVTAVRPSAAELDAIKGWILGGAPLAAGAPDGRPEVIWSTPNDLVVTRTDAAGLLRLDWRAVDPEAQPISGSIEVLEVTSAPDDSALCEPSATGWTSVPGSDVTAGTLLWTAPHAGSFCFRAVATDAAAQTVAPVARKPVRF